MSIKQKTAIELCLPEYAKEVEVELKKGFVSKKAVKNVYESHLLIKKASKFENFFILLKEKFPKIFPPIPDWQIKEAARHFLNQTKDREFLEDISSPEEYMRAVNALS